MSADLPESPPVASEAATSPSARLLALGLALPPVAAPVADYVPALRVGDLVWTSGQLPFVDGHLPLTGPVGAGPDAMVPPEAATDLARRCALNALAAVAEAAGGLDAVLRVVKVTGYVASAPGFTGQPGVLDGASRLLQEVFGEAGRHVRTAVGVAALPLAAPVEVELLVQVRA